MKYLVDVDIAWAEIERVHGRGQKNGERQRYNPLGNVIQIFHYENDIISMD